PPSAYLRLSLHDALPISERAIDRAVRRHTRSAHRDVLKDLLRPFGHGEHDVNHGSFLVDADDRRDADVVVAGAEVVDLDTTPRRDRKSTRLNSSHVKISY